MNQHSVQAFSERHRCPDTRLRWKEAHGSNHLQLGCIALAKGVHGWSDQCRIGLKKGSYADWHAYFAAVQARSNLRCTSVMRKEITLRYWGTWEWEKNMHFKYLSMRWRMGSWTAAGAKVKWGIERTMWTASIREGLPDGRGVRQDGRSAMLITWTRPPLINT